MFASYALTAILASGAILSTRADVVPTEPSPGDVFNMGSKCHIAWAGDTSSTTAWSNMTIHLMTGSNLAMVPLITVAVTQDGTKAGTFDYPCVDVTPNSAIYFYQFTASGSTGTQWTTRFTIASPTGQSTPPTNTTDGIQWGTGALSSSGSGSGSSGSGSSTPCGCTTPVASRKAFRSTSDSPSSAPPSSAGSITGSKAVKDNSGALGSLVLDSRIWQATVALGVSALAFTVLL